MATSYFRCRCTWLTDQAGGPVAVLPWTSQAKLVTLLKVSEQKILTMQNGLAGTGLQQTHSAFT